MSNRQKLMLKQKKKKERKLSSSQKVALHAVQKQLQVLKLKELLILIGFSGGSAFLRIPMQAFPSVEPITFFAILVGWLFGKRKGFLVGASAGFLSNFFMLGGHGPWTFFQVLGWGIAGFLGGFLKNIKPSKTWILYLKSIIPVILLTALASIIFDLITNIGWVLFMPFSIIAILISGIPFMLIHLISNLIFSFFLPLARRFVYEKGHFNEKDICLDIINRFRNKSGMQGKK